jgi:hypothetical protein
LDPAYAPHSPSLLHTVSRSPRPTHAAPTKADGQNSVGYSIYDLWDLGEFDQKGGKATKWGTKDELLACVKKLKDNGAFFRVGPRTRIALSCLSRRA